MSESKKYVAIIPKFGDATIAERCDEKFCTESADYHPFSQVDRRKARKIADALNAKENNQ